MSPPRNAALLSWVLLAWAGACAAPAGPASHPWRTDSATVEAHVRALASDAMAGRATGAPGSLAAARYVAGAFEAAGLRPGGDDGGWLQDVGVAGYRLAASSGLALVDGNGVETRLELGTDWAYLYGGPLQADLPLQRIEAEEDLTRAPDANGAALMPAARRELLRHVFRRDVPGWGALVVASERPPRAGPLPERVVGGPGRTLALFLTGAAAGAARQDGAVLRVDLAGRDPLPAVNVVGVLPGVGAPGRPELAQEVVIFSAHYDHLGTRQPAADDPDADLVFNGADDDASGVAAVLELARAFGAGPPPARTLIFLAVTGEELGGLGTGHYLEHPLRPLSRTVCNLNFEMVGRPDADAGGVGRLWLTGHARSNLGPAWAGAGLPIGPDRRPAQRFFQRSDNYAFALRGIVAQTLSSFGLHDDYHRPSDEPDTLDYEHLARCIEVAFQAARLLADGSLTPAWTEGGRP